ncbi:MAG: flavin reductase family protein [Bacteroidetes bacterium]|nr:flavin reductase family protein [Bacteroidota bacterium]
MIKAVGPFDMYNETIGKLAGNGIILLAGDPPNPMTIGWGTIGEIWHMPIFTVLVRPTRYTFGLMEKAKDFTVCVLPEEYKKQLELCGTKSGRDMDKISVCGFTLDQSAHTRTPFITQSAIHYECRIVHKHRLDPAALDPAIDKKYYETKDWHMVYYGEILGTYLSSEIEK